MPPSPTSPDDGTARAPRARPVAIEVRDLAKSFRVPAAKVDTLKERVVRPFATRDVRELSALRGISFDVHRGEFFGIVGRNGSGKSTLLKLLASIYRPDRGRIRMAGRLAPFIELGVGINPELTARENVALNGVMMGLGRREATRRLDTVLDFAELHGFTDLKLKNYSSGMLVRLAFAVMVEADADIMLIDEVLAVGDAAFAQKCMDVFREKRRAGRTLVLVTHDMATVQAFCDRALVIHDGEQQYVGDPEEAALRYFRLNFGGAGGGEVPIVPDVNVRVVSAGLRDGGGASVENVEQGQPIGIEVVLEARHELDAPVINFHVVNADERWVFGFSERPAGEHGAVAAGRRIRVRGTVDNPLTPGRYTLGCWISRARSEGGRSLHVLRLVDFFVYGTTPGAGSVGVRAEVEAVVEPEVGAGR